jgi:hypothetical protein
LIEGFRFGRSFGSCDFMDPSVVQAIHTIKILGSQEQ